MKYYELTCTILPDFSEEKLVSQLPAQPIKREAGSNLISLEFYAQPGQIQDLEKSLKADSQIKRYLILNKKPGETGIKLSRRAPRQRKIQTKESKIELKEIEKKLDEILKEQ